MSSLPPESLRARVLAQVRASPSPTLADRRRRTVVGAIVAVALSLLLSCRLGVPDSRSAGVLALVALGGGLAAALVTWMAASRGSSMLGRSRGALAVAVVFAPLALLAWPALVTAFERGVVLSGGTPGQHLACAAFTLLFALGPFATFAYARRGSDPLHPRLLGAALGAAAGAWGGAMIDVHCKVTAVAHLAIGHALPILAISALGALAGARVFGVRVVTRA